jgi:uncharacterized cupin superfamily protein
MVTVAKRPAELPAISLQQHEILEGDPDARCAFLAKSADDNAAAGFWSCNPGRYEFEFDYDEFVYLIEGAVTVSEHGTDRTLQLAAGDSAHFPQGVTTTWHVTEKLVKYFVARRPF